MGEEDANRSVETRKAAAELIGWLADAGLRNLPFEQIVDGFSRRLNEMGVAVVRTYVGMNTLHSMLRARSLIWDRMSGPLSPCASSGAGEPVGSVCAQANDFCD